MPDTAEHAFRAIEHLVFSDAPTPLVAMDRLGAMLGKPAGTLFVKRDDLTGLCAGGNKVRKLEYVVADALRTGATCLVTGGGVQSNSARVTAAAAAMHGLRCRMVLDGRQPKTATGNLALDHLLGAELTFYQAHDHLDLERRILEEAEVMEAEGELPYVVPIGASTPVGALGYVSACLEMRAELPDIDLVVTATGSGGTHAGLAVGFGDHSRGLGVRVSPRPDLVDRVVDIAVETAPMVGWEAPSGECVLDDDHMGQGYGAHTADGQAAIQLAARTEGIVLDPVYTGKAMSALIDRCRSGQIAPDATVVFLHTGGMPGLLSATHVAVCSPSLELS
jgi:D-cysteine desulfhydrase